MSTTVDHRPAQASADGGRPEAAAPDDRSVGELVKLASEQLSDLMRQEMRLAQVEMAAKGKRFGLGGGLLGGAGVFALVALQAAAATAIAAIAVALPVWAAALIVTGALALVAAALAVAGRMQLRRAGPARPERAIAGLKADVERVKESASRGEAEVGGRVRGTRGRHPAVAEARRSGAMSEESAHR